MVITDTPGVPFDKVALDIVGPLEKTDRGNEYILTLQDQFSKFCMAIPLKNTLASTVADMFVKRYVSYFGSPRVILTDQGKNFISSLFKRVAQRFKIKKITTSAYHPQSNGSLERSHAMLGEYLRQYSNADRQWDEWVDLAMLNYNSCVQESTKFTPYELVFGRLPRLPTNEPLRGADMVPTYQGYLVDLITRLNAIQRIAFDNLVDSKFQSKKYYDRKLAEQNFSVGDYVFLLSGRKPGKLDDQYTGPHKILEVINKNNFRIQIGKGNKVVHANRLKISHILNQADPPPRKKRAAKKPKE